MAFICPDCEQNTLEIVYAIELGSDVANDEHTLQSLLCSHCGLSCVAEYCESRRGASDSWSHLAHRLPQAEYKNLNDQLQVCNTPRDPKCGCLAHQYFRVVENGRLRPLSKINHDPQFFHLVTSG